VTTGPEFKWLVTAAVRYRSTVLHFYCFLYTEK